MKKSPAGYVAFIAVLTSILFLPSFSFASSNEPNSSPQHPKSFLDVKTILSKWEANYAHIDSLKILYTMRTESYKPPASDPNMPGPIKYVHYERIEQGPRYHVRTTISKTGLKDAEYLLEDSFDGTTTRRYYPAQHSGNIEAGLINIASERDNMIKQYMLFDLQGTTDKEKEMYPNGIPSLSLDLMGDNNTTTISPSLELVNGQLCHIIKKTAKKQPDKNYMIICLAHEKGMLPIKYQVYTNGVLIIENNMEEIASTKTGHGVFWYPKQGSRYTNMKQVGTVRQKYIIDEFIPNIAIKDSDFTFDFPKGTEVVDRVQKIIYTVGVEGSRKFSDSPGN